MIRLDEINLEHVLKNNLATGILALGLILIVQINEFYEKKKEKF
jgi:hypothetical protein